MAKIEIDEVRLISVDGARSTIEEERLCLASDGVDEVRLFDARETTSAVVNVSLYAMKDPADEATRDDVYLAPSVIDVV